MATESASLGSFLSERPVPRTRTLEAKCRWDIDDVLAGIDELLGQQVSQAAGDSMAHVRFPRMALPRRAAWPSAGTWPAP